MQDEQADMLAMMASEQGESLSAFVRGRVFARDSLEAELQALQTSLLAAIGEATRGITRPSENPVISTGSDPRMMGLLVEILLQLRSLSNPGKTQAVRAEVARLGFAPFG